MTTVIWKGIYYNSLEYFQLSENEDAFIANSKIIGAYEDKSYLIEYILKIDKEWRVQSFEIEFEINSVKKKLFGLKKNNDWTINGNSASSFSGFAFIDISLTPFTNTLPIRNLHLNHGQEKKVNVIYIDILETDIKPARQKYRRSTDVNFRYENIPNDFEADIDVDEDGLVVFYPSLFERVASFKENRR